MAKMFEIKNVEMLTNRQTEDILCYLQTVEDTNHNIEVLHFDPFAFRSKMFPLLGVNNTSFMDMYLNVTFPGLSIHDMQLYEDKTSEEEIHNIFKIHHLVPHKTVLLIPYSKMIDLLSEQFWNHMADELIKKDIPFVQIVIIQ